MGPQLMSQQRDAWARQGPGGKREMQTVPSGLRQSDRAGGLC